MELTKKTSLLSDSRFPAFIRGNPEFDMLRRFTQSYFESLEEEGKASHEISYARENSDVDSTTTKFLDRFYEMLCPEMPKAIKSDKRLLLKHSRELYQKKGTPDSFKLLFRVVFNETINLKYPNENILRASDGIWTQPVAIHVVIGNTPSATVLGLSNKEIICNNDTGIVRNIIRQVRQLDDNTYEFRIDKQKNTRFYANNTVKIGNISGIVVPCVNNIIIIKAGRKFKQGQLIKVDIGDGTGTLAKVNSVDSLGGIKSIKIIKFGLGYTSSFSLTVSPSTSGVADNYVPPEISGAVLPITDSMSGFSEYGSITKTGKLGPEFDYFLDDYVEIDYTASVVRQFSGVTSIPDNTTGITDADYAILNVTVDALLTYPGFWLNNRGKISDPLICLPDNNFYQDFSYVIQSSVPQSQYVELVKNIIHPAGMKMFSDLLLSIDIDVSSTIISVDRSQLRIHINDILDVAESINSDINKELSNIVLTNDVVNKETYKTNSDYIVPSETNGYFSGDYAGGPYSIVTSGAVIVLS